MDLTGRVKIDDAYLGAKRSGGKQSVGSTQPYRGHGGQPSGGSTMATATESEEGPIGYTLIGFDRPLVDVLYPRRIPPMRLVFRQSNRLLNVYVVAL